ncbi:cation:dicarboxylase symporter family transporter [Ralstonia sp. 1B3]
MKHLKKLHVQVLIGLACAVVLGIAAPQWAVAMKPIGQAFIALLKMMLAPIIFCTLVQGLAHVRDLRMLGRMGVKSLVYFEVVSTVAMVLGFVLVNVFEPGVGLHATNLAESADAVKATSGAGGISAVNYLLSLIPHTLVDAFAKGDIVQVLIISILAGLALNLSVGPDSVLLRGMDEAQKVLFRMLGFIMKLAPLGAFGAMAAAVGSYGGVTLLYLLKVIVLYYAASLLFVFGVLSSISWMIGLPYFSVLKLIRDEMLLIFGTASSEVAFPRLVEKLQRAGCDEAVVGFVLPAGYSFNLDGTSIYMAIAVGFIAQATDTPFSLWQQLGLLAILSLTSRVAPPLPAAHSSSWRPRCNRCVRCRWRVWACCSASTASWRSPLRSSTWSGTPLRSSPSPAGKAHSMPRPSIAKPAGRPVLLSLSCRSPPHKLRWRTTR